jgi:hypothetical protein
MKSQNRRMLYACLTILAAAAVWPSAGWARPPRPACDVKVEVPKLLQNWATQLSRSTPDKPEPLLSTYGDNAVLVATCKDGPLTGAKIKDYFVDFFLKPQPEVTFDPDSAKIGGTCLNPFASGLYDFKLKGDNNRELKARYTYVFQQTGPQSWRIAQHHSSLQPESTSKCPD